jgi:cytochrome c biogenesis factor
MIPEIGQVALILALMTSLVLGLAPLIGAQTNRPALMNLAFPQQELPRTFSPNLQIIQNGLNILNGITLIGGSIGVFAGIIASQFA